VHRSLVDEVVERAVAAARTIRVGDPLDPSTEMGTMVTPEHRDRVLGYVERGRLEGLRPALGGRAPDGERYRNGAFVAPTIFADVPPSSVLAREEIFGPVLAVTPFDDVAEAVAMVNSSVYGLTASIWTRDLSLAHRTVRQLQAGYVWVNTASRHFVGMPFGGVKDSGLGREESVEELHSFTQSKAVTVRL
jgi:2-formylbenzoate dehydrogenase